VLIAGRYLAQKLLIRRKTGRKIGKPSSLIKNSQNKANLAQMKQPLNVTAECGKIVVTF